MDAVMMNNLIRSQEELGVKIKTVLVNMKKDSPSRKTLKYITDRRSLLSDLLQKVIENHDILKVEEKLTAHSYMTRNHFGSVMRVYNEAMEHLDQCERDQEKIEQSTSKAYTMSEIDKTKPQLGMQKFRVFQMEKKLGAARQSVEECEQVWVLQSYLQTLQKQWEILEESHMTLFIEGECLSDEYFTKGKFEAIQEEYDTIKFQLLAMINKVNHANNHSNPRDSAETRSRVTLPKITIPIFTGHYESWYSFHDLFKTIIHDEKALTNAEKMQYLKTHVRGEPAKMIQHLNVSDSNYDSAWEILTRRYQNERLIVSKFVDKLLDFPRIEQPNSFQLKNMFDEINECLAALKNQGIETSGWDPILNRIIARKWDSETNNMYELSLSEPNNIQSFSNLMEFLEKRFKCLEAAKKATINLPQKFHISHDKPLPDYSKPQIQSCWYCKRTDHNIYHCISFKTLNVHDRIKAVRNGRVCYNCINHDAAEKCNSTILCHFCGKQHHSMIHIDNINNSKYGKPSINNMYSYNNKIMPNRSETGYKANTHVSFSTPKMEDKGFMLLATGIVETTTYDGTPRMLRVLYDQGSEASFCTEESAQLLGYPKQKVQTEIKGIADEKPKVSKYSITITLKPRFPSTYRLPVSLIVLPKLTTALPNQDVSQLSKDELGNKILADPTYYRKGPIDIILGVREYSKLVRNRLEKTTNGMIAQDTEFGWILSGCIPSALTNQLTIMSMTASSEEVKQLTKFWELEEVQENNFSSTEDQICEKYYIETTTRGRDGCYTVRIPFKNQDAEYSQSRQKAAARLFQLEKSFAKNEKLREQYKEFMHEYADMGHMKKVTRSSYGKGKYYIPHHAVIREESLTTKLRVVFDASSKEKGGLSLNENMYKGPRLQQDLSVILMRWRKHKIAFMSDIEKMYRFIKIHESDMSYQRILWRSSPDDPIDEYDLATVAYGTTSAPYLAVRTLQQLAIDEQRKYPLASTVTLKDFYVDDLLSGAKDENEAKRLQIQLIHLLKAGGFNLRKWSSNSIEVLQNVPEESREANMSKLPQHETRKSLGVMWSPLEDDFRFHIKITCNEDPTKRFILAEISKIFDPMGWIAPVIVRMKLLIQELWTNGTKWDDPVDENSRKKWLEFQNQIKSIEAIRIPRWITYSGINIELHGFSDASEIAYGAVVYSRIKVNGQYIVYLLQAKSKVAPKKHKTTLPRLELCAANLLARLIRKVDSALECGDIKSHCWTDSMITLGWIRGEAQRWQTFVANRVSEIQRNVPSEYWNHVATTENPADVLSRGIEPSKLENHKLWWEGPHWLRNEELPSTKTIPQIYQEIVTSHHALVENKEEERIWERFSELRHMTRVISYCYRFINKKKKLSEQLTCDEIRKTTTKLIKIIQTEEFEEEYKALNLQQRVKKASKLSTLDPFMSEDGIIRVGGRLEQSNLRYDQKHPIILPYNHHVSKLIIRDAHQRTLHGGNRLTLACVRQSYWIIGAKRMVKSCVNKCVKCIRYKAITPIQKMGQLPAPRVNPSSAFSHSGVDMAGPVQVRATKGRGNRSTKGYIAVFVCLATKAIHLELVGDLSTDSFIAAFERFTARRGPIAHIYSDHGRNFVGAARIMYTEWLEITQSPQFQNAVTNMKTQWHFIPPLAPNFGGIWEAGVKSMKHHLKRVIGDTTLTYEELSTLLCQIEACLNSRPLCAQTDSIDDGIILTPSHFLIGREAVGSPDPVSNINMDLQTRWKLIQKMKKDIWKSWTRDYLHQLQQRYKWKYSQDNLKIGSVVLIKDENISPSKWPLAKITEVHTGRDGINRVLTLRKSSGTCYKRAINAVIPLPINEYDTISSDRCKSVPTEPRCNMIRAARAKNMINKHQ